MATGISFAIALCGVALGDMNVIAPLLSMFFLTSYGILNLSAGLEELITNPSWRPKFRVPAAIALAGFVLCLVVMMMIAPGASMIAGVISGVIYYLMKRRSVRARWGDMLLGVMMFTARQILHRIAGRKTDERTWRPNLLVLSGAPSSRWYLVELANAISGDKSFLTIATVIPEENWSAERIESLTDSINDYLKQHGVVAFVRAFPGSEPLSAAQHLIRAYGFGPLVPNTILLGETEKAASFVEFARLVKLVAQTRRNLVVVREDAMPQARVAEKERETEAPRPKRIDLWSAGKSDNIGFTLALAVLLGRSREWEDGKLVLKRVVNTDEEAPGAAKELLELAEAARIPIETEVFVRGDRPLFEVIRDRSADADMVFLGMRTPDEQETAEAYSGYYADLLKQTESLPVTVLSMAAEKVEFSRIFQE
jgi:nucleotide-binding universal stress UspA family protein